MMRLLILITSFVCSVTQAHVRSDQSRGELTTRFPSAELCIQPKHFDFAIYRAEDRADERGLCEMNVGVNTAICAKTNSTNPGLNFYRVPVGISVDELQARGCVARGAKLDAKYKVSTSCSYTPSILGYYHLSRALGDILHVPVAVMRTFDLHRYKDIAQDTEPALLEGSIIRETWNTLYHNLNLGRAYLRAERLLLDDVDQTYGALQLNPRNESLYKEFVSEGPNKIEAFRNENPIFATLQKAELNVSRNWTKANVQAFAQLKDLSDMILIDTIMGQQDRIRNTHAVDVWYSRQPDGRVHRSVQFPSGVMGPFLRIRELMLKDNDCGVVKTNRFKDAGFLRRIRHLNPKTYERLQTLNRKMRSDSTRRFFIEELLFTEADFRKLQTNLAEASEILMEACKRGALKLDLELDSYFNARPTAWTCDVTF